MTATNWEWGNEGELTSEILEYQAPPPRPPESRYVPAEPPTWEEQLEDDRGSRYSEVESWSHTHTDSRGILHRCWHVCRHNLLTDWRFWVGMTMSFPVEHMIWEKLPVFRQVGQLMGLE